MKGLTHKQRLFVREYLVDLNATQAYLRAGYKGDENVAGVEGHRLLKNPKIDKAIKDAMNKRAEKIEITAEKVLREYARLGFLDPRKLFDDEGNPLPITELDDDTAAAVAGLDVDEIWEGRGDDRRLVGYTRKVRLADKKGALDSIARHLGMFDKDSLNVNVSQKIEDLL